MPTFRTLIHAPSAADAFDAEDASLAPLAIVAAPRPRPARRRRLGRALAHESGQGTVEYVGLLLLMASVLAGVVVAANSLGGEDQIGKKVVNQIGKTIDKTAEAKPNAK